jgi:hypothetical protein
VNLINSVGYNGSSANFGSTFDFQTIASQQQQHVNLFSDSNPFTNSENNDSIHGADHQLVSIMNLGANSSLYGDEHHQDSGNIQNWPKIISNIPDTSGAHEYHEISDDDENPAEKEFDLGPSLMDEMDSMFRSMTANSDIASLSQDFDRANKKNENTENASKLNRKNSSNQSESSNSTGEFFF